ncbi:MAG: hypothetical protein ACYSWW_28205 [Planctomycetota bacterium]|jgi:hypothetical protein
MVGDGAAHDLCATAGISLRLMKPGINIKNEFLSTQADCCPLLHYLSHLPF